MKDKTKIYVIIPAYNEEGRVGEVVGKALDQPDVCKVIVIDDSSSDGTALEAEGAGAVVIRHPTNMGVGAAIKSGYRRSIEEKGDIAVVMAADGQHDPSDIPSLVKPILEGEAEYVVGERFSGDITSMPKLRRFGNKLLTKLTSAAAGIEVKDSQYGYAAISRKALERINVEYLTDRWGYPNDMFIECAIKGVRVKFVPSKTIYGIRRSYIRPPQYMVRVGTIIFRGFLRRIYFKYGVFFFSLTGILSILVGLIYGAYVSLKILEAGIARNIGSLILVAVLILGGIQMVLFGFLVDMVKMLEARK